MTSLVQVDPQILRTKYGRAPVPAILFAVLDDGDDLYGIGGLAWMQDRCWLCLNVVDATKVPLALSIVRKGRDMLKVAKQMGETAVYTPIDRQYPKAEKLLRTVGLSFFARETIDGEEREIWHVRL